jgi:hypothetical protein
VSCSPTLSIFFGKKLTKVSVDSFVENFLCGGKGKKKRKTMKTKMEEEAAAKGTQKPCVNLLRLYIEASCGSTWFGIISTAFPSSERRGKRARNLPTSAPRHVNM